MPTEKSHLIGGVSRSSTSVEAPEPEVLMQHYGTRVGEGPKEEEDRSERQRIERESTKEAIIGFLSNSFINTVTWGIWNTLDLVVLLAMAAYLPNGDAFAGVATAMTVTSLTALSVSNGMSSALETLISNAYGANKYSTAISKYLIAGTVVNVGLFAPMAILFLAVPQSWLEMVFPRSNAEMLGAMVLWLRLSPLLILPQLFSFNLQKFAIFQRKPQLVTYSASVSLLVLPILLVIAAGQGTVIAFAAAITIDKYVLFAVLAASILMDKTLRRNLWGLGNTDDRCSDDENEVREIKVDHLPSDPNAIPMEAHTNWSGFVWEYLRVGSPSAVAYCIDVWTFEFMIIIAARCGPSEAAAWVIMQQMTYPLFSAANGLSSAAAADAGHAYGAGCRPAVVLKRVRIVTASALAVGLASGIVTLLFGPKIFPMLIRYSHESKEAIGTHHTASNGDLLFSTEYAISFGLDAMLLYALHIVVDVPFFALQGAYRGVNKQTVAAELVFVALWCVALPIAVFWPSLARWGAMGEGCVRGIAAALFVGAGIGAVLLYLYLERNLQKKIADKYLRCDEMSPIETNSAGSSISFAPPAVDRVSDAAILTRM